MSTSRTWFITGTSRGIGLQLVRQLTGDPANVVVASCRSPEAAEELKSLAARAEGRLHVVRLDVADEASIWAAAEQTSDILGDRGLDYLINNAAVLLGDGGPFDFSVSELMPTMQSNVIGPAMISQAFLPLLEQGKRKVLMNISSLLGSITFGAGEKWCSYSMSKAALNMLTYKQSVARQDLIVFSVEPGRVKTDMGGEGATVELDESIPALIKIAKNATKELSGKFIDYEEQLRSW